MTAWPSTRLNSFGNAAFRSPPSDWLSCGRWGRSRTSLRAPLQSVYDALSVLVTEGLIRRIQPSGSPARFEDRVGDNHHHLICRICGSVVDVDCAVGKAPCLTAHDDNGYQIDEAEVAYWGRCPDCQGKSKATSMRQKVRQVRVKPDTTKADATTARRSDSLPRAQRPKTRDRKKKT
jgi:hypothetical protein